MNLKTLKKSQGHVAFVGDFEFYLQGGELFRAKIANAFDLDGYRHGRWEAPERMTKDIVSRAVQDAKKNGIQYLVDKKWKRQLGEEKMSKLEGLLSELREPVLEEKDQKEAEKIGMILLKQMQKHGAESGQKVRGAALGTIRAKFLWPDGMDMNKAKKIVDTAVAPYRRPGSKWEVVIVPQSKRNPASDWWIIIVR